MAIIIEKEKRGHGFLNFILWLFIMGVIGFGTYYIFFKQPDVIDEFIPAGEDLGNIQDLSKITLNPEVIKSDAFQSLEAYISLPTSVRVGRPNPFLPLGAR